MVKIGSSKLSSKFNLKKRKSIFTVRSLVSSRAFLWGKDGSPVPGDV